MRIDFKNLGPVKSGEIDLNNDLLIFSGPNNTGKTYVAYLLYALPKESVGIDFSKNLPKDFFLNLKKEAQFNLNNLFFENIRAIESQISKNLENSVGRIFGLNKKDAAKFFNSLKINFKFENLKEIEKQIKELVIDEGVRVSSYRVIIKKESGSNFLNFLTREKEGGTKDQENDEEIPVFLLKTILNDILAAKLMEELLPNTHISPVERNSIYTFSKELSIQRNIWIDKLLETNDTNSQRNDPLDLLERRATRYPLPIRNGLEISEDLANYQNYISEYESFANELEQDVLDGKVNISQEGEVQFIPNKAKSKKLPIHLTASIVKSLSSLIIYFRHIAKRGDMIILDEPELNLHPDNQIRLTRLLGKIVNKGFKVVINTHSDYVVRELNNMIALKSLNSKKINKLKEQFGYKDEFLLSSSSVSAYLFYFGLNQKNQEKQKSDMKELEVNEEGFEVETIDKATNTLNKISDYIFNETK